MSQFKHIFEPITINKMEVKNRIFVPPMGTSASNDKGEVTEMVIKYFDHMAKGGAGLLVSEVSDIDARRRYNKNVLGIFDDSMIAGWKAIADTVHQYGAKFIAQLIHAGTIPLIQDDPTQLGPVGASPVPHVYNPGRIPHELTCAEMEEIKQMYVDATRRAMEAGCDGVEIHCAHNHGLLGAFVSPLHNKRVDEYGGDIFGLMKFPLEVIKAVRDFAGPDFPISVRISGSNEEEGGLRIEDTCRMAKMFEEAGVDFFDVSNGTLMDVKTVLPPTGTARALNADYAKRIKEVVNVPVVSVGRINDPWIAEDVIASGRADAVFMGRAILCDPELPNKAKEGRGEEIRPCIGCSECVTSAMYGGASNCTLNPELGHELDRAIEPAKETKKVLVVGGGPAGLEAAAVAAMRGHEVTLMEKENGLGGQFIIASYPPVKQEYTKGLKYLIQKVKRLGVKIELNKTVTADTVKEFGADAVILATGGKPMMPAWLVNGSHPKVVSAWDALRGMDFLGTNLLIVGGGLVGCETADYLAAPHYFMKPYDRKVSIIEMQPEVMINDASANRDMIVTRLMNKNVNIITNAKVEEVLKDGITYSINGEQNTISGIDAIICAVGTAPDNSLADELKDLSIPLYVVGDAKEPRKIMHAIYEGAAAAKEI